MKNTNFIQYTTDYINGVMSLRTPQKESLDILEDIIKEIDLSENINISDALLKINNKYPTCTDFERDFISITFALATGVGKTRLMGAFITYLYTNYGIKNFFVVAPSDIIYEKLKSDLGNPDNPKYVFKGIGCFSKPPKVIADDDYRNKNISLFDTDINIYVYNIDKFNSEDNKIRAFNEWLGMSFFEKLSNTKDLVMIMDESHHYRADAGWKALNELKPLLGLELTATPKVSCTGENFKNVVYEYPLSAAIKDGYTRVPYAVTRSDVDFHNFGDEQIDKLMIEDGFICHEKAKSRLEMYAKNEKKPLIKPFMLVVCKDINHAEKIYELITSNDFKNGKYKNKTIVLNYKQSKKQQQFNNKMLQGVENVNNPVEVVIHVDKLKEGWDVNNLYTIVPLRMAASPILRQQMVGRGLRLPYGKRTGDKEIDSVMLTAHDKFKEIIEEAQKGDSIFNQGKVINIEDIENDKKEYSQIALDLNTNKENEEYIYNKIEISDEEKQIGFSDKLNSVLEETIVDYIYDNNAGCIKDEEKQEMINKVAETIQSDEDLGKIYKRNENPLTAWINEKIIKLHQEAIKKFIPIPSIITEEEESNEYYFEDFDLECLKFNQKPIENKMLIQNLTDASEREYINEDYINFDTYNPKKELLDELRNKSEIDYEKTSKLLYKIINQICEYFTSKYKTEGMKNVIMMYKKEIANEIYSQMLEHFKHKRGFITERVIQDKNYNIRPEYNFKIKKDLFDKYDSSIDGNIKSVLFDGIKRGVFDSAKFDSEPELKLAKILERDTQFVINWLRPSNKEFNITYNHGRRYEPDFVVEVDQLIYLIEVKAENQLEEDDVLAKKEKAIKYCKLVSEWAKANTKKEWRYVFIPANQIHENSTFKQLVSNYIIEI